MKRLNLVFFLSCLAVMLQAQFINNGGTVTIQNGATLSVEGNLTNNSGGTITNDGTIEVMNDFVNSGSIASGASSLIRFIGSANSNITSGGALFKNAEMAKTASTITLQDAMNVSGTFTFAQANNQVMLGNNNLTIKQGGSVASAGSDRFFNTNGIGKLLKELNANGALTFEVGNGTQYSPISCNVTGSAFASASVGGRVYTSGLTTKYSESTDYITREWDISATGITDYDNQMTGTYADGDVTGTENLIKGSYYTTDWHFDGSAGDNVNNTVTAQTDNTSVKLTGMNFFGKANLKAFLSGALSGSSMTTSVNTAGVIPLTTPYTVAPFNAPTVTASSIPANATDWILVEVRDSGDPSTVISKTSAFIMSDGSIVNFDNEPLRLKNATTNGYIALRHRNHLGIRTNTTLDLVNPTLHDFTTGTGQAYTNPSITSNANMRNMSGNYAMWGGNSSTSLTHSNPYKVSYAGPGNDNSALLIALGSNKSTVLGNPPPYVYNQADLNLNGNVRYAGPQNDNAVILQNLSNNKANVIFEHN